MSRQFQICSNKHLVPLVFVEIATSIYLVISNINKYIVKIANCSYTLFVHSTGLDLKFSCISANCFTVLSVCLFNHI